MILSLGMVLTGNTINNCETTDSISFYKVKSSEDSEIFPKFRINKIT
jgi:hypothetical protein